MTEEPPTNAERIEPPTVYGHAQGILWSANFGEASGTVGPPPNPPRWKQWLSFIWENSVHAARLANEVGELFERLNVFHRSRSNGSTNMAT